MATFLQKFLKIVRVLRVNETKVTSRNALIDNHFTLKSNKETKIDERTLFSDFSWILDLPVKS